MHTIYFFDIFDTSTAIITMSQIIGPEVACLLIRDRDDLQYLHSMLKNEYFLVGAVFFNSDDQELKKLVLGMIRAKDCINIFSYRISE